MAIKTTDWTHAPHVGSIASMRGCRDAHAEGLTISRIAHEALRATGDAPQSFADWEAQMEAELAPKRAAMAPLIARLRVWGAGLVNLAGSDIPFEHAVSLLEFLGPEKGKPTCWIRVNGDAVEIDKETAAMYFGANA